MIGPDQSERGKNTQRCNEQKQVNEQVLNFFVHFSFVGAVLELLVNAYWQG